MAQTTVLAVGTTAANSSDFTGPCTVSLFSGETDQSMGRVKVTLYQKDAAGHYFPYVAQTDLFQTRNRPLLTNTQRTYLISDFGTFRAARPACVTSVGIETDDAA